MPKGQSAYSDIESSNWNVAPHYSQIKVMKLFAEIDEYKKICEFGTTELVDEFSIRESDKSIAKIRSLKRLISTLRMLISNTYFAVKKADKPELEKYKKEITRISKLVPMCFVEASDEQEGTKKTIINESVYEQIYELLYVIDEKIKEPLNRANLIYLSPDEFDPDKWKEELAEDLIYGG